VGLDKEQLNKRHSNTAQHTQISPNWLYLCDK